MLIREGRGCSNKGGTVKRNNSAALGQGPGPLNQGIYRAMYLSSFTDTETPTRWEELTACCPQALDPRPDGTRHFPHHQPIRRIPMS